MAQAPEIDQDTYKRLSSPEHLKSVRQQFLREIEFHSNPAHMTDQSPHLIENFQRLIREIDEALNAQNSDRS